MSVLEPAWCRAFEAGMKRMRMLYFVHAVVITSLGLLVFSALLGVFGIAWAITALVLTWVFAIFSIYRIGDRHAS